MLAIVKPRHLRYDSIDEWMGREHITSLDHPENPALQERLFHQLGELREHLWRRHLASLTSEERRQLETGQHPSQSHSRYEQAKPIFEEFRARVELLPYVAEVFMPAYHVDRLVFRVKVTKDVDWLTWHKDIPQFYRGFEVGVLKTCPEPDGPANRSQPVGRDTNRTPSAAGSGG